MKLFVFNTPYWFWTMRPKKSKYHDNGGPQSLDPLDEHHTYFLYQFLKSNLVDEVIIYSNREELDHQQGIPSELEFREGKMRVSYDLTYKMAHYERSQLLYCRHRLETTKLFPQHTQIIKVIAEGFPTSEYMKRLPFHIPWFCRKQKLDPRLHSLVVSEGPYNRRFINQRIPALDWPTLSNQGQYIRSMEKLYDWIFVGTTHPRKRLLEFGKYLLKRKLNHLKGCVLIDSTKLRQIDFDSLQKSDLLNQLNVVLKFDLDCKAKMEALCQSKVFVHTALEDSGPRSLIEAGQARIPIVALHHHGSASLLVRSGINGELSWSFDKLPALLKKVLDNYGSYDCSINDDMLNENRWFPAIQEKINQLTGSVTSEKYNQ